MQYKITVTAIILLCMVMAFAGCTVPAGTGSGSSGTGRRHLLVWCSIGCRQPGASPTDVVPDQNLVTINIGEKDYLGNIPVTFEGGMGQIHVTKIEVTLYRSDGQVKNDTIKTNKGENVDLEGTKTE